MFMFFNKERATTVRLSPILTQAGLKAYQRRRIICLDNITPLFMGGDFESLDFILFINPQSDQFKGVRNRIGIVFLGKFSVIFITRCSYR